MRKRLPRGGKALWMAILRPRGGCDKQFVGGDGRKSSGWTKGFVGENRIPLAPFPDTIFTDYRTKRRIQSPERQRRVWSDPSLTLRALIEDCERGDPSKELRSGTVPQVAYRATKQPTKR